MDKKNIYQAIIFFVVGVFLFWLVYRDTSFETLTKELYRINWFWVGLSILLNLLSQWVRAIRWKTLFVPLKYSPKTYNLFFAVLLLAFTNQIIPRGGEIARLGVINKYEKVPFSKLFGIALVERLTDFIILILLFLALLVWQFDYIQKIVELPQVSMDNMNIGRTLLISGGVILALVGVFFILRKFNFFKKIQEKLQKAKKDIAEGFASLYHIEHKFWYLVQSLLIYAIWFAMLHVLIYAYPPTSGLGIKATAFAFGLSTLAFLLPVQAGMGAWHFVVVQSLLLYGIGADHGKVFSLMAHSATNHVYLITGALVFALLPLVNGKRKKLLKAK